MKTYNFQQQLKRGSKAETYLDSVFNAHYQILPSTDIGQRNGIDRHLVHRLDCHRYALEYKADSKAAITGNAFVETISVDKRCILGWAITSRADRIVYFLPQTLEVYLLDLQPIRQQLNTWRNKYPTRRIANQGYCTHGILVPVLEIASVACRSIVDFPAAFQIEK